MTPRRSISKALHKPVVVTLGGLALGALAIGGLLALIQYVVAPMWRPQERGGVSYEAKPFVLWYRDESPARASHAELAQILQKDLQDLTALLGVDLSQIPDGIDVFVHDSVQAMTASILSRKGGLAVPTYRPALDLLASEAPRPRLAELVLAFGWGRSTSQLLEIGAALYAAAPTRNYHAFLAALPERLFVSTAELIRLEEARRLPSSLYQRVDAPYAPAAVGDLGDLRALLQLSADTASPIDLVTWEAASFVQLVVEEFGGMPALARVWKAGSTEKTLAALGVPSPAAMDARWLEAARRTGPTSPEFPYLRAVYLLASGDPDAAFAETERWPTSDLSPDELFVVGQAACLHGAFAEASAAAAAMPKGETRTALEALVGLYRGWGVAERDGIRVLSFDPSPAALEALASSVEEACRSVSARLGLSAAQLPPRLSVLIYPDEASREAGASLVPLAETQNAVLHLVRGEDVAFRVASVLPAYAWGLDTYSRSLREGLAAALSRDRSLLVSEACQLRSSGEWLPLRVVDFGSAEAQVVWVEMGLLMDYLLESGGPEKLRLAWVATSPQDRYVSLDFALQETYGLRREDLETALVGSILRCDGR